MLTDRAPFEYRYLSGRLLTQLFQHDDAARRPLRFQGGINAQIATLQVSRRELDHTNMHALAAHAAQRVSDHTSDLTSTPTAKYVKDQLDLFHGVFEPHMGWHGGKVACYWGELSAADSGRTILALFGSASNVVGYRTDGGTEYYPSDIMGLYTMLDLAREPGDPEIDFGYRRDDGHINEQARADAAIRLARRGGSTPIGVHAFLAHVFLEVEDFHYDSHFTGRVVIGTPLWIATPQPTPG